MPWTSEYRCFVVRTYLENGHSVVATQRAFRLHFNIPRHGPIPDDKAIRHWVEALEDTGSTRRPKGSGGIKTDGATAHTAQVAMVKLRQMLGQARLVSRRGDVEWSPRSPDLSICDFFLWGYLKAKVFRSRPHNLEELKMRIQEEIAAMLFEMCQRATENFRHRLQQCIATDGHHLPDAIFKKCSAVYYKALGNMLKFGSKKNLSDENKCTIRLLDDGEVVQCDFQSYHKGRYLLDFVFNRLNLIEGDYFGLRYVDQHKQRVRQFKEGKTSCDNKSRQSQPCTNRSYDMVELLKKVVLEDRRMSVEYFASKVGVSVGSVRTILHEDLKMRKVFSRWIPRMLTDDHKAAHVAYRLAMLTRDDGVYPLLLCFRVKFYPCEPLQLQEEVSRYQLFLQLRRDLMHGRLYCQQADAAHLAALLLQAELGDHSEQAEGYVQQCQLLVRQTPKLEEKIEEIHSTLAGMEAAQAETAFLKKAATLDTYGVDPHPVKDQKGNQVFLGLSHAGLLTFQGSKKTQHFRWNEVQRLNYEGKMFIAHITIMETKHTVGFKCSSASACKHLWRAAVEQRLFYTSSNTVHCVDHQTPCTALQIIKHCTLCRPSNAMQCTTDHQTLCRLSSSSKRGVVVTGGSFFSRGSRFRYQGRCEREVILDSTGILREAPRVRRTPHLLPRSSSLPTTPPDPDNPSQEDDKDAAAHRRLPYIDRSASLDEEALCGGASPATPHSGPRSVSCCPESSLPPLLEPAAETGEALAADAFEAHEDEQALHAAWSRGAYSRSHTLDLPEDGSAGSVYHHTGSLPRHMSSCTPPSPQDLSLHHNTPELLHHSGSPRPGSANSSPMVAPSAAHKVPSAERGSTLHYGTLPRSASPRLSDARYVQDAADTRTLTSHPPHPSPQLSYASAHSIPHLDSRPQDHQTYGASLGSYDGRFNTDYYSNQQQSRPYGVGFHEASRSSGAVAQKVSLSQRLWGFMNVFLRVLVCVVALVMLVGVCVLESKPAGLLHGLRSRPEMLLLRVQYYQPMKDALLSTLGWSAAATAEPDGS
ncbi:Protein of unknown function DUF4817 [Trinorchestia longiramus]|nr:Protein of unknown function DUF4817 [Trinorchestia longiramus]